MPDYWIDPSARALQLNGEQSHSDKARELLGFNPPEPEEYLMRRGWVRVVACLFSGNLFFERRVVPTEKQFAALKNLAVELNLRLDDGRRVIHDPAQEVF